MQQGSTIRRSIARGTCVSAVAIVPGVRSSHVPRASATAAIVPPVVTSVTTAAGTVPASCSLEAARFADLLREAARSNTYTLYFASRRCIPLARTPVRRETLADQAVSMLRGEIFSGELQAGEKVNIDDAAERLGMSQIPVREALRALDAVGLVEFVPQRGYTVKAADVHDFLDTYRLRITLDPMAARLSVPNLETKDLERAQEALEQLTAAQLSDDAEGQRRHHMEFHFAIYGKCGSPWLLRILEMLWENSERYQRISPDVRESLKTRAHEHYDILAAAASGDVEKTAAEVAAHISRTTDAIAEAFAQRQ
jgi:DNA-binding GntR family transcriptional regulator